MTNSNDERRQADRFQTLNLLSYSEKGKNGEVFYQGIAKTLDLSESGALIAIPNKFTIPDNVSFDLALDDELVNLSAEIIDQTQIEGNSWRIRIQFKDMRPAIRHKLALFILNLR